MTRDELRASLTTERLHRGMQCETLIDKLLAAPVGTDPWSLDLSEEEKNMLGQALAAVDEVNEADIEEALRSRRIKKLKNEKRDLEKQLDPADPHAKPDVMCNLLRTNYELMKAEGNAQKAAEVLGMLNRYSRRFELQGVE